MATQAQFNPYSQAKGTLVAGQTIAVNKYTVQVERYLSQGGFAHVYLVRTPTPVFNTTHHVLKRIAVANEAMLTEVKKEVDVMRLLRGHPNIVYLIDAAWHKMSNGTYEVFILMEYCPGGGIIDMMNRRLRERLTEAEILQIFVDVCEGVACMHNSRPPLLHRDLKVENILQSSSNSYKLCDFGSATTVSRPPTTTQEIRAVEADLNRHTTLQYRAPEMIDVYSKRPIDEKSDVWALGVLLYKLCYYTTPFEEHGPLAILNVQYRTPPYPVYSSQMNLLIASMLREHGAQRPSVFELLAHVHRLRGTKSQFQYNIPVAQPLSPRHQLQPKPAHSPNPLEGTVTYASQMPSTSPTNQGVQARDKVLEAIAPMRRGRPPIAKDTRAHSSRPPSPQKAVPSQPTPRDKPAISGFAMDEDNAWKSVVSRNTEVNRDGADDAWKVNNDKTKTAGTGVKDSGFGDDFAERLWNSTDPNASMSPPIKPGLVAVKATVTPLQPSHTKIGYKEKDAFAGLGLMTTDKPAPTLGEARKLRTGLAIMSTSFNSNAGAYNPRYGDKLNTPASATPVRSSPSPRLIGRPPLSPQPQSQPSPQPQSRPPRPKHSPQPFSTSPIPVSTSSTPVYSGRSHQSTASPGTANSDNLPAESRFPSLEELDATFSGSSYSHFITPRSNKNPQHSIQEKPALPPRRASITSSGTGSFLKPHNQNLPSHPHDGGARSAQVTGVAMRQSKLDNASKNGRVVDATTVPKPDETKLVHSNKEQDRQGNTGNSLGSAEGYRSRLVFPRKDQDDIKDFQEVKSQAEDSKKALSPNPSKSIATDWLTGDDDEPQPTQPHQTTNATLRKPPVLRESPSKRASFIEKSEFVLQEPVVAQHGNLISPEPESPEISPTVSKFKRAFPSIDVTSSQRNEPLSENWSPVVDTFSVSKPVAKIDAESSSSEEEVPEDASRSARNVVKPTSSVRPQRKGRQSSVHDLLDLFESNPVSKEKPRIPDPPKDNKRSERPSSPKKPDSRSMPTSSAPQISPSFSNPAPLQPRPLGSGELHSAGKSSQSTSRSRPQSMFITPSKGPEKMSSTANNLVPPEQPRSRNLRRTSISDMVQRYEAIGNTAKPPLLGPGPPSPAAHKGVFHLKPSNVLDEKRLGNNGQEQLSVSTADTAFNNITRMRASPTRSSSLMRSKTHLGSSKPLTMDKGVENGKNTTQESMSSQPNHIDIFKSIVVRNPALEPSSEEPRSPSPEQPYKGVGKLIDQWQRKTAEAAEATRGNLAGSKRGGMAPKRAGLVNGSNSRG